MLFKFLQAGLLNPVLETTTLLRKRIAHCYKELGREFALRHKCKIGPAIPDKEEVIIHVFPP